MFSVRTQVERGKSLFETRKWVGFTLTGEVVRRLLRSRLFAVHKREKRIITTTTKKLWGEESSATTPSRMKRLYLIIIFAIQKETLRGQKFNIQMVI